MIFLSYIKKGDDDDIIHLKYLVPISNRVLDPSHFQSAESNISTKTAIFFNFTMEFIG